MSILGRMKANKMKSLCIWIGVVLSMVVVLGWWFKVAPVSWRLFGPVNASAGVAIGGYDPVAYHLTKEAKKGTPSISYRWKESAWHFASAKNKSLFQTNPKKYAPQFGGFCAEAIRIGLTADINPKIFHIHSGKLYLFFAEDPKTAWVAQIGQGGIAHSEANWGKH